MCGKEQPCVYLVYAYYSDDGFVLLGIFSSREAAEIVRDEEGSGLDIKEFVLDDLIGAKNRMVWATEIDINSGHGRQLHNYSRLVDSKQRLIAPNYHVSRNETRAWRITVHSAESQQHADELAIKLRNEYVADSNLIVN